MVTHGTCTSPYESDTTDGRVDEKKLRNVSQQCSLEYSSEMGSITQIPSEKSENNLSDISEIIASRSSVDVTRRSSVDGSITDKNQKLNESCVKCNHYSSLSSLTVKDRSSASLSRNKPYRNSFNDTINYNPEESNNLKKKLADKQNHIADSQEKIAKNAKSLVDENEQTITVEALQLCNFYKIKSENVVKNKGKDYRHEIQKDKDYDSGPDSLEPDLVNVKKETSV